MGDNLSPVPEPQTATGERPAAPEILALLESESFAKTPSLRTLLLYLWEHRDEQISEYAIATEALGRSALFDSKIDATVRVQISRLRQRLEKYYEREAAEQSSRVLIPLGSHQLRVDAGTPKASNKANDSDSAKRSEMPARQFRSRSLTRALAATCVLLLLCCAWLAVLLLRKAASPKKEGLPEFWASFAENGLPTRIVLPIPTFYSYSYRQGSKGGAVMLRDTNINNFERGLRSPRIQKLNRLFGNPSLAQAYTVTSDTFAAVKLTRYLDGFGVHLKVRSSDDAVLEALDSQNVIAIGTPGTLAPLAMYMNQLEFKLIKHETVVVDRIPQRHIIFSRMPEAQGRSIWPGLIAVMPAQNPRVHLLILAGRYTSALVALLTSDNGLRQLRRMWLSQNSPTFYEAVIAADMDGAQLVKLWPVALHRLGLTPGK